MRTVAILPVKSFAQAKQRLAPSIDFGHRRALVEAMYSDTLVALRRTRGIDRIFVVTSERVAARIAEGDGITVLEDTASSHSEAVKLGINRAIEVGAERVLLVPGDCPLLDSGELEALLAHPVPERSALIVPDRHGEGTNALLLTPPTALVPSFGEGSRQRHTQLALSQGTHPEAVDVPGLGLDIDTPEDLQALVAQFSQRRGGAAHTRGLLSQMARTQVLQP
jgi:2-phospho-L-lactate guanylyltransferase